ncbi:hypothetical protein GGR52DRAFT_146509 [Hypoxylon sp. FL1284]|nr:hypothetical protein GGR52DRAFT_146509 [Hypoxylon sp. FL1284]
MGMAIGACASTISKIDSRRYDTAIDTTKIDAYQHRCLCSPASKHVKASHGQTTLLPRLTRQPVRDTKSISRLAAEQCANHYDAFTATHFTMTHAASCAGAGARGAGRMRQHQRTPARQRCAWSKYDNSAPRASDELNSRWYLARYSKRHRKGLRNPTSSS